MFNIAPVERCGSNVSNGDANPVLMDDCERRFGLIYAAQPRSGFEIFMGQQRGYIKACQVG